MDLEVIAGFGIIVPEINIRHWPIPNDRKHLHEAIEFVILTVLVWTWHVGNTLPHALNASQLRERIANLLQNGAILFTEIVLRKIVIFTRLVIDQGLVFFIGNWRE